MTIENYKTARETQYEALRAGLLTMAADDDFVGLWQIDAHASRVGFTEEECEGIVLKVIREVLERGWVFAGDMASTDGCEGQRNRGWTVDQIMEKIKRDWSTLGRRLNPGDVVYLRLTAAGRSEAARELDLEKARRLASKI